VLKFLYAFILGAMLVAACGSDDADPTGSVTLLPPLEYDAAISAPGVFVVNVHIPYEGEIEGTDAFIPFDDIAAHVDELPVDKDAPLYVYCRSGRMSADATPDLQALGYTNIIDLEGGMVAWEAAGLPLQGRGA
jgi:rhodanese-related sulfurtransferase